MVWVSFSLQIYSTFEFRRFKFSVVWVLVWVSSFYEDGGGSRTVNESLDPTPRRDPNSQTAWTKFPDNICAPCWRYFAIQNPQERRREKKNVYQSPPFSKKAMQYWKRLKGKNPEGKNFRKLLRRKQSSAKISKISRNTVKSSQSDIFYLLRNLLKYLLRTFFSSAKFSEVFTLCVFTLWLFPTIGDKMAGTNEFAFFRCRSIRTGGGGPESGWKHFEKCLLAGTGTKKLLFKKSILSRCMSRHFLHASLGVSQYVAASLHASLGMSRHFLHAVAGHVAACRWGSGWSFGQNRAFFCQCPSGLSDSPRAVRVRNAIAAAKWFF